MFPPIRHYSWLLFCLLVLFSIFSTSTLETLDLGGQWLIKNSNGTLNLKGQVPGDIYTDLKAAQIIGEPYYRYNDVLLRWVAYDDWTYSRTFYIPESFFSSSAKILLECDGIDTVSTIKLNGKIVGTTNNMFLQYKFDVKDFLLVGNNTISVMLTSAVAYAKQKSQEYPYEVPSSDLPIQNGEPYRNFIRKEQSSFSWNWAPAYVPQAIWKPIRIVGFSESIFENAQTQTTTLGIDPPRFNLTITFYLNSVDYVEGIIAAEILSFSASKNVNLTPGSNTINLSMIIGGVNLWWPRGYGNQTLYDLNLKWIQKGSDKPQQIQKVIGFRDFKLIEKPYPGQTGASFYFQLNGVPVYAKGSNFVPVDSFKSRVTPEILENLLESAVEANINILRVWGGGIYQQDAFYDITDRLGIMVWQEFMFGCAMYPRDEAFLDTVGKEVSYQVKRLMSHPSIMLWSANNENEEALGWFTVVEQNRDLYVVDYNALYIDTVRRTLISIDESRPYLPSSPSNGAIVDHLDSNFYVMRWGDTQSEYWGDVHFYDYKDDCTDVSHFPKARFVSEYGHQSFPSFETWMDVTVPSDWFYDSPLMNHRQHYPPEAGTVGLVNQIRLHFNFPNSTDSVKAFEDFLYLSQCMQAVCVKAETEHFRRGKGEDYNTMGAIYWMFNSIWQSPSKSSLEYGGKWKILHYYVKNFFNDFLVSSFEDPKDSYSVHLTSDLLEKISGTVSINLWSWAGKVIRNWTINYDLLPLESKQIYSNSITSMIQGHLREDCLIALEARDLKNNILSSNVFYLSSLSKVFLYTPRISISSFVQQSSNEVSFQVVSDQVSPFTYFDTTLCGHFNDNAILLLPGIPVVVRFIGCGDFTAKQLQVSLKIKVIKDTY